MKFFSMHRRTSAWAPVHDTATISLSSLVWGIATIATVAGIAAFAFKADTAQGVAARDKTTLCRNAVPPRADLVLLDQTDALAGESGARFINLIRRVKTDLPIDGRLTIVPFGGDLGQSLAPAIDICSPGTGAEANELVEGSIPAQARYDNQFAAPLEKIARDLQDPHESPASPIAAQIMRAANDPALSWRGRERELVIITDGLENTNISKIYSGGALVLPPPPPNLLKGVTVRYYELANPKHSELQTAAVRAAWKRWLEGAGATVRVYAPGYPDPDANG